VPSPQRQGCRIDNLFYNYVINAWNVKARSLRVLTQPTQANQRPQRKDRRGVFVAFFALRALRWTKTELTLLWTTRYTEHRLPLVSGWSLCNAGARAICYTGSLQLPRLIHSTRVGLYTLCDQRIKVCLLKMLLNGNDYVPSVLVKKTTRSCSLTSQ